MRLSVPKLGAQPSGGPASKSKKLIKSIVQLVVLVVIISGAYFLLHKHNVNKSKTVEPRTVNQLQTDRSKADQSYLSSSDYVSYQLTQSLLVGGYISGKDLDSAQKVIDEVLSKVPKDKLTAATYSAKANLDKAKNDIPALKEDLKLLIERQKASGDTSGADASQKYLDSLK
jgi:hypothetical protein